jgi:hypothetical protein
MCNQPRDRSKPTLVQRKAAGLRGGECVDLGEQCIPGLRDLRRPFLAEQIAERISDDGEESDEQLARRAVGIVRGELAAISRKCPRRSPAKSRSASMVSASIDPFTRSSVRNIERASGCSSNRRW